MLTFSPPMIMWQQWQYVFLKEYKTMVGISLSLSAHFINNWEKEKERLSQVEHPGKQILKGDTHEETPLGRSIGVISLITIGSRVWGPDNP